LTPVVYTYMAALQSFMQRRKRAKVKAPVAVEV